MTEEEHTRAWNNLVLNAAPDRFPRGDILRAAAIASIYLAFANNGGLNSFLTSSYDLDAGEVVASLEKIGATYAAKELQKLLDKLGEPLLASTQDERWERLEELWTEDLDECDVLSVEADQDIVGALEKHVEENLDHYLCDRGTAVS